MSNKNVIPFPQIIDPARFMQTPKAATELLSKGLIDLDSYQKIALAITADIAFIQSIANDFFTEQFDAKDMAGIAVLLQFMAEIVSGNKDPETGYATGLENDLNRASLKLDRLSGRLAAMEKAAT